MSSIKTFFAIGFFCLLTACSLFEPFIDRRRNAGTSDITKLYVGRSTPQKPVVCANPLWTNQEKIQQLADDECLKQQTGTHAVQTDVKYFSCRLLLPTRTFFECKK